MTNQASRGSGREPMRIPPANNLTAEEYFSREDLEWLDAIVREGAFDEPFFIDGVDDYPITSSELAMLITESTPDDFEELLERIPNVYARFKDRTFARVVLLGLEYGVACGDGGCANFLGAMYYSGNVIEQDYVRAEELYKIAESRGVFQAMVNLGYIYEYGRTGEPDQLKAYLQYAKVAALANHYEAQYKLGDMYMRGDVVDKDVLAAYILYNRSYEASEEESQRAQSAIRIANIVSDPQYQSLGIPYDPMGALGLYQLAERGLRVDIARGYTYYRKRLQEALEGQERMREVIEDELA